MPILPASGGRARQTLALLLVFFASGVARGRKPDLGGVEFARVGTKVLMLDLYQPADRSAPSPLVIWVHGGAWRSGSRGKVPVTELTLRGYAIASVDYRLSGEAPFPAQVHDIKAAIRFLRANAESYSIDPKRFVIAGSSAGGHLAALVGVSNGVSALEGTIGDHGDVSSDVHSIVSYYGASNLETILSQSTPHGLSVRVPALQLLLRGQPSDQPELAKLASPVAHVDGNDPPLLLIHGDQDPQMPINQSHELDGTYTRAGCAASFHVVHGGAHGGAGFYEPEMIELVDRFLSGAFSVRADR
jgi:acetyl esterase/lipase